VKSADSLVLHSEYYYRIPSISWLGPYADFKLETALFEGEDVREDANNTWVIDGQIINKGKRLKLTESFLPLTLKEVVGLTSVRGTFSLGKLKFGTTIAMDYNQYLGFKDADEDGRPDVVDDFPDDPAYWLDSDNDGLPDEKDYDNDNDGKLEIGTDANGNGYIDETETLPGGGLLFDNDGTYLKPEPFDLTGKKSTLTGVSVDVGYPVFSSGFLDLLVFAEAGKYLGSHNLYNAAGTVIDTVNHGWGLTAPGIRATILKFINLGLEYRMTGENFVFSMFDQNYDIDRVGMQAFGSDLMLPITRDARLLNTTPMKGVFGSLSVNILSMVTVNGAYQHMMQDEADPVKGIYGSIDLAQDLIPKLEGASAYLNRMNVDDPFDIYSEGKHPIWVHEKWEEHRLLIKQDFCWLVNDNRKTENVNINIICYLKELIKCNSEQLYMLEKIIDIVETEYPIEEKEKIKNCIPEMSKLINYLDKLCGFNKI
jgi:hypothetical protein